MKKFLVKFKIKMIAYEIKKIFPQLSQSELSEMWQKSFDPTMSAMLGKPVIDIIGFDDWLCQKFNLNSDLGLEENLKILNISQENIEILRDILCKLK